MKKRQQFSSPEEIVGIPNRKTAMDFMVAKNALKKKIQEAIQVATGPKSLKQRLSLVPLRICRKNGWMSSRSRWALRHNALRDLSTQLQDAGRTETDTIEVNITTITEELQTISEAGEEQFEAVKYLLEQERDKVRKEQQAKRYDTRKACDAEVTGRDMRRNSPCLQTCPPSLLICNQHRNSGPRLAPRQNQ